MMLITSRTEPNRSDLSLSELNKIRTEYIGQLAEEWIVERAELIEKLDSFLEERIRFEFSELRSDITNETLKALVDTKERLKIARNVNDALVEENITLSNTCAKLQRMLEKLSAISD